jgi:hypothetical protein
MVARLRFRLQRLVLLVSLLALVGGGVRAWWGAQARHWRQERAVVQALRAAGLSFRWDYAGPAWLARWLADAPQCQRVAEAWCDRPETPLAEALPQLAQLPHLGVLLAFQTQLEGAEGDRLVQQIATLGGLRVLLVDASPRSLSATDGAELASEASQDERTAALEAVLRRRAPHLAVAWLRVH